MQYFNLTVFFLRFPELHFFAVPILAVPGTTAKCGGNFLAVMKYDGTDFGGSRYCEIRREFSRSNEIWRYLSGVNEILEYYVTKTQNLAVAATSNYISLVRSQTARLFSLSG